MTRGRSSWGRRLAGLALRVLIPAVITAIAAGLGYAFAVYPIWYHVDQVRKTETLGGLISVVEARKQFLGAYLDDSRVDATAFDDIAWAVKTVMTPFVGYAPAPGQQHNAHINSFQFRDQREPAMPKPPGVTRIFLTGASVAFSAGAPDDQRTIGGYLQSLLDRRGTGQHYEVFTFAAPAWSSTHERIAIENRLSDLQPDLVVELTGIADALYGERGHNVLWARALTDQYYWELVNIALRRAGFAAMTDVQDASPSACRPSWSPRACRRTSGWRRRARARERPTTTSSCSPPSSRPTSRSAAHEKGLRFTKSGYFTDPEYYKACYQRIDALLGNGGVPDQRRLHEPGGAVRRPRPRPRTSSSTATTSAIAATTSSPGPSRRRAAPDPWRRGSAPAMTSSSESPPSTTTPPPRSSSTARSSPRRRRSASRGNKHDEGFPATRDRLLPAEAGLAIAGDLDYVGFYEKPLAEVRAPARDVPRVRAERLPRRS